MLASGCGWPAAGANAAELDDALGWLNGQAVQIIRGSRRDMYDGTAAFQPQAGSGYDAFWLRDYAYMLEGCPQAFSQTELVDSYWTFLNAQRSDGACVDCVKLDGTPIYKPGYGTMGINPVADGSQFMVDVAWHTYRATEDLTIIAAGIDRLELAMGAVPRNSQTGLVHIVPGSPQERCPYGFTDTIPKQGDVLFCSLLYVQAGRQMADLYDSLERPADAQRWTDHSQQVEQNIRDTFWRADVGLFDAATVQCDQPDVWGSAFAAYLGVADQQQTLAVANYFKDNHANLVQNGQLRHLPGGMYWEAAGGQESYQNGGYWATPMGWFVHTLDRIDPALADQTIIEMVDDLQARGVNEWVNGDQTVMPNYCASGALPLAAIREIRDIPQPPAAALRLVEQGGTFAAENLAAASAGAVAFAVDELDYGGIHMAAHINDETYGNDNSWIGTEPSPTLQQGFVGVDLGGEFRINSIAFGRDNSDQYTDRWQGQYLLQVTTVADPDENTPDVAWTDIGTLDYLFADGDNFSQPHLRHRYEFAAVMASGVRLIVPTVTSQSMAAATAIDELEVYAAPLPGDANGDGRVDEADATALADHWQESSAAWADGDFNGDGAVSEADATILAANWQSGESASVPQPSTAVLLSVLLPLLFVRRMDSRTLSTL